MPILFAIAGGSRDHDPLHQQVESWMPTSQHDPGLSWGWGQQSADYQPQPLTVADQVHQDCPGQLTADFGPGLGSPKSGSRQRAIWAGANNQMILSPGGKSERASLTGTLNLTPSSSGPLAPPARSFSFSFPSLSPACPHRAVPGPAGEPDCPGGWYLLLTQVGD